MPLTSLNKKEKEIISLDGDEGSSTTAGKERRGKRQRCKLSKLPPPPEDIEIIELLGSDVESDEDSDIEVLEKPPEKEMEEFESIQQIQTLTSPETRSSSKRKKTSNKVEKKGTTEEEEIIAIGRSNVQRFPHLREHCTEHVFIIDTKSTAKKSVEQNKQHCNLCFCFICDEPASECSSWRQHCLASGKGNDAEKWKKAREKTKTKPVSKRTRATKH